MPIGADFSVATNGDIRHAANATVYTGLEFHAWLQGLAMDAQPSGDDNMSMVQKIPTELEGKRNALRPSLLNMKNGYNIDATAAQYLKFCSLVQGTNDAEQYSGLKTQGSIVAGSPIYVMQSAAKLTDFWADGHIQILVKCKAAGAFVDSGLVDVASRKYGQSYSWATVDLTPGGEQIGVVVTETAAWQTMTEGECAAASVNIAFTYGLANYDMNNGNGPQPYRGKITLSGGITAAQAAQVLHYLCREASASTFNGTEGWKYRKLYSAYTANDKFPFGEVIAGVWYVARGWFVEGVGSGFTLVDDNGVTQAPPVNAGISMTNLVAGDYVLVGRYDAIAGYFDKTEYTLNGVHNIGAGTVVVNEVVAADTPTSGTIRLGDYRYPYSSVNAGTKTFTLTGTLAEQHAANSAAWVPFLDKVAASGTEAVVWKYPGSDITAYYEVRNGNGSPPIKEAVNTQVIGAATASVSVIRTAE